MRSQAKPDPNRRSERRASLIFALTAALAALAAYGILIPSWAAFGDDPNFLWAYHRGGAAAYRPFMAWIREYGVFLYEWASPFLGETVMRWRIAALGLRWLSSVLYFITLRRAYPRRTGLIFAAGLLFLLYPGFSQQAVPVEFILHFFSLCCILASIAIHQSALNSSRRSLSALRMIAAGGLSLVGVFSCEYFIGLEIVRAVLVYWSLDADDAARTRFRRTAVTTLPFLAILALFLYWRLFRTSITYLEPVLLEELRADPLSAVIGLMTQAVGDLKTAFIDAFRLPLSTRLSGKSGLLGLLLTLVFSVLFYVVVRRFEAPGANEDADSERMSRRERWRMVGLGLFAGLVGGAPVWGAGLEMTLTLFWDRLTLSFAWGAALAAAAFLSEILRPRYRAVGLALLAAVPLGYQFQVQNRFRRDWELTRAAVWELKWRAPDLAPGTLLLFDRLPTGSLTDNSLNALVNWTYETAGAPEREAYKVFEIDNRRESLLTLRAESPVVHGAFQGVMSDAVIAVKSPSACLMLLRPGDRNLPFLSKTGRALLPIVSDPGKRVIPTADRPMTLPPFFADEPAHGWCFYYERAEAAADRGDWAEVLRLAHEAEAQGLAASTAVELRSFLIAALIGGDPELAERYAAAVEAEEGVPAFFRPALEAFDPASLSPEGRRIRERMISVPDSSGFDQEDFRSGTAYN